MQREVVSEDVTTSAAPVLISNTHVLELLQTSLASRSSQKSSKRYQHRDWIESKVIEYLQSTPCTRLDSTRRDELQSLLQSRKKIKKADGDVGSITGFDLTEAESLQILNFMPMEPVEIHLMVHDLHSRMSENEQDALLELIGSYRVEKQPEAVMNGEENDDVTKRAAAIKKEEDEDILQENGH